MTTYRLINDVEREQDFSLLAGMIFAWDEK